MKTEGSKQDSQNLLRTEHRINVTIRKDKHCIFKYCKLWKP